MEPSELMKLCLEAEPPNDTEKLSDSGFLVYLLRLKRGGAISKKEMQGLSRARREGDIEWFTYESKRKAAPLWRR
jgi:hypothetical protein